MMFRLKFAGALGVAGLVASNVSCAGAGPTSEHVGNTTQAVDTLTAVTTFGSNPGSLQMFTYVPSGLPANAPLVLALHGCTQSASTYEDIGWNALADQYKFYVVYPQQQSANNSELCFNWAGEYGNPADITRDQGEAASVKQMVDYMKTAYSIDPKRVFVTGFSAGAAYSVALLALYPDVFAAGASFSGIPFKCATTLAGAITCQDSATSMTPTQWGDLVRSGDTGYAGPFPRISVWQGSADTTVNTANLGEIVNQWTNATGVSAIASVTDTVAGFPHNAYKDGSGVVQVESYSITGMGHAVAIDPSHGCGTADTYAVDKQICAVDYVAKFLGLEGAAPPPPAGDAGGSMGTDAGGSMGTDAGSLMGTDGGGSGSDGGGGAEAGNGSGSGSGSGDGSGTDAGGGSADTSSGGGGVAGCTFAPSGHTEPRLALFVSALGLSLFGRRRSRRLRRSRSR